MKLIVAVIQPEALDKVRQSLMAHGAHGMTISEACGYGQQRGRVEVYRGARFRPDLIPRVRLEVVAEDADVDELVDAIMDEARTGTAGDGKIWVSTLDEVVRVRTGQTGAEAI